MTDADIKEIQSAKKKLSDFIKAEQLNKSNTALIDRLLERMPLEVIAWHYKESRAVQLAIKTWTAKNLHHFME
jgi:hypothetical protein